MSQGFTKGIPVDTDATMSANSDFLVPSQSAVRSYVGSYAGAANNSAALGGIPASSYALKADIIPSATTANLAFLNANAAFEQANTARTGANTVGGYANSAYGAANLAWTQANTAQTTGQSAYDQANTARTVVNDTTGVTKYVMFASATSGITTLNVASGLTFVPSSNTLNINGPLNAVTKSFVIDHPTKEDMKLRYGSLEGPENGVYVRGRVQGPYIYLPDYWSELVDENTVTVSLTAIGLTTLPSVLSWDNKKIVLDGMNRIDCFYLVLGERKDVEKLVVEY